MKVSERAGERKGGGGGGRTGGGVAGWTWGNFSGDEGLDPSAPHHRKGQR